MSDQRFSHLTPGSLVFFGSKSLDKYVVLDYTMTNNASWSFNADCECPRGISIDCLGDIVLTDYNSASAPIKVFDVGKLRSAMSDGVDHVADVRSCGAVRSIHLSGITNAMAVGFNPMNGHLCVTDSPNTRIRAYASTAEVDGVVLPLPALPSASEPLATDSWEEHLDPASQCKYWFNTTTGESTWEAPSHVLAPGVSYESSDGSVSS